MKDLFKYFTGTIFFVFFLTNCTNYRKLLIDEVVLKDGNSQTGKIIKCDSSIIKLKKIDESINIISWENVDTVQGKKLQTLWLGFNTGYYNTPYFSVFRNESFTGSGLGFQLKAGIAFRGNRLFYFDLSHPSSRPYPVTKLGIGYQKYLGTTTYLKKNSFFTGLEINLMNVKYNNGPQMTIEPFTGFEKRLNEHLRIHFKLGLQLNFANKNEAIGINTTIGIHFMRRDFTRYYRTLNKEHRIPRR